MQERAAQIEDKMAEVREEQAESIERREQLLQELDMANQLTKREIAKQEEEKVARKQELQAQVTAKISLWSILGVNHPILQFLGAIVAD